MEKALKGVTKNLTRSSDTKPNAASAILYVVNEDWAFLSHRLPMALAARDAGFEVHVATRFGKDAHKISAEGFTVHALPFERGNLSPLTAIVNMIALRRIKRNVCPDLIHHSGIQLCLLGGLSSLGLKTPQVNALTGLGYMFTSSRAGVLRRIISVALRYLLNRDCSMTLVQNPDDLAALRTIGVKPDRIILIAGSGVDTDELRPLPEPEGLMTVGFAGRLLVDKGIRALVSAQKILHAQGTPVQLLIAGEPDLANPASISLEEAESWNNEPGITWLGHIEDIHILWKRSHIGVLPSHREGLPKSLLEAAAFGRPLIATDAPGCREIVIQDRTGLLVPIENPQALADAIGKLAASSELRQKFGAAARQLVVEKMSAKTIGLATVALYRRSLAN